MLSRVEGCPHLLPSCSLPVAIEMILGNVAEGLWESCGKPLPPQIKQPLIWPWLGGSDKDNAEIRQSKFFVLSVNILHACQAVQ